MASTRFNSMYQKCIVIILLTYLYGLSVTNLSVDNVIVGCTKHTLLFGTLRSICLCGKVLVLGTHKYLNTLARFILVTMFTLLS